MAIYAVINQPDVNAARLGPAVAAQFDRFYMALEGNQAWLVASASTAKEISDKLGVTTGENGAAIIVEVGSYFGRANPNVWSWIKTNWEAQNRG